MIRGCTHSRVVGRLWAQGASAPKKLLWGLWAFPPGTQAGQSVGWLPPSAEPPLPRAPCINATLSLRVPVSKERGGILPSATPGDGQSRAGAKCPLL